MQKIQIMKKQAAASKSPLKGTMNEDEIKLNKQLLKEIKLKKIGLNVDSNTNL